MKQKAHDYFLGKNGSIRVNCAQSVAGAWAQSYPLEADQVKSLSGSGGGKAPHGWCGALYALILMAEKHVPEAREECIREFERMAGSLYCKTIRSQKKASCLQCVEYAADIAGQQLDRREGQSRAHT